MYVAIKDLIVDKISGEWGTEGTSNNGVKVIRTSNFTNEGSIDYNNIVYRKVDKNKITKKALQRGDIIIEKSGGSPNQPVGRVVFFDTDKNESYLCNNFTTILRPNQQKIFPKYLFYQLFINHIRGETLKYQNKTTGIINLKLDAYLSEKIYIEEQIEDQIRIANILSNAEKLLGFRRESIRLLNDFLTTKFLSLFGDPIKNDRHWVYEPLGKYIKNIISGSSFGGEEKENLDENELGVLKVSAVTLGTFDPKEFKAVRKTVINKKVVHPLKGDLLFSRANTRELVGATCIVDQDYYQLFLPDKIWKIELDRNEMTEAFVHFLLQDKNFRNRLNNQATGSNGSMLNISMAKLRELECPIPPISLQNTFAEIVKKVEIIKLQYKNSLNELEHLYRSLTQLAFKGLLDIKKVPVDKSELAIYSKALPKTDDKLSIIKQEISDVTEGSQKANKSISKTAKRITDKLPWDSVAGETKANWIKKKYAGYHFNSEMLHRFLLDKHITELDYYSSEEIKKNPPLTSKEDVKKFLYNALSGETPFLKIQQYFHNANNEDSKINLTPEDMQLLNDFSNDEKSGIYFSIETT